jgi:DNA-directed RNA polymerase alpha subunit
MSGEFTEAYIIELEESLDAANAEIARWKKENDILRHQVITCGVAASHPDPNLTLTRAYANKWSSAQAEAVRKLRADSNAEIAALKSAMRKALDEMKLANRTMLSEAGMGIIDAMLIEQFGALINEATNDAVLSTKGAEA